MTERRNRLGGAVYVLPNLITTGNLFFGFFSIVKSLQGQFGWAASAIFLAGIFDVLDGRIARLTNGTSEFGVQYDSLCDCVSFGVAPAFLMYQFGLFETGRMGWVFCFLFLACGALRLARFNVLSAIGKASGDFTGLPIPMAAIAVASFVLLMVDLQAKVDSGWMPKEFFNFVLSEDFKQYFLLISAPILALLMVSNIVFRSHKVLKIRSIKPFQLLVVLVMIVALVAYWPELFSFVLVFLYVLSGPFEWIAGWQKPTDEDEIFTPLGEDESYMEPTTRKGD
jgi:CDP-diacylglycerol--serine O-phosphatidyltransferase